MAETKSNHRKIYIRLHLPRLREELTRLRDECDDIAIQLKRDNIPAPRRKILNHSNIYNKNRLRDIRAQIKALVDERKALVA